jgi:Fe2+ transport system protein FeoA
VKENISYKVKNTTNSRLADMGVIPGAIFKVIKRTLGIIQIRIGNNNDIVFREETEKEIDYEIYI